MITNKIKLLLVIKYQRNTLRKILEYTHPLATTHQRVSKHLKIRKMYKMTISMFQIKEKLVTYPKFQLMEDIRIILYPPDRIVARISKANRANLINQLIESRVTSK